MSVAVTGTIQFGLGNYATEVAADAPISWWRLDEFSGTTAADSGSSHIAGTYTGGYTLAPIGESGPFPQPGGAVLLNGTTAYVTTGSTAAYDALKAPGSAFTVEFWIKASAPASTRFVVTKLFNNFGWEVSLTSAGKIFFGGREDAISDFSVTTTAVVANSAWRHVVCTWNGTTSANGVKIYVDGALDAQGTATAPSLGASTTALTIGTSADLGVFLAATLDEVAIYAGALSGTRVLAHYAAAQWTEITGDARAQVPVVCEYGIAGASPDDRIADTGKLTFALNNSTLNSGGLLGYYSPLHASKRAGFGFNIPVRFKLVSGTDTAYKFRGSLADIVPTAGLYGERLVSCTAVDWMDEAARIDLPDLAAQQDKLGSQIVSTTLSALSPSNRPAAVSIEGGLETYGFALDGGAAGQRPKVREVLHQIAMSGFDYGYVKGDTTQGGTFMWENRQHRSANPTVQVTLSDSVIDRGGIAVPGSRDELYSSVQVFVRPTRVDTAATTVLFSLQTASTLIAPGETNTTIFGPYRDPANNDYIGGTAQVAPVATTDYTMNAAADGSGADLTANFTVTASFTGLGVRFTISNNSSTAAGYVTKLQVRGKGIYRYDAMIEVATSTGYGTRPLSVEMPYQNSANVAADVANLLAHRYASPFAHVPSVRFWANRNATLMAAALLREPGDRIALSETLTGVDAKFTINSVRLECQPGGILWCTWGLEPADATQFWLVGVAGSSELDTTTVLGW
jgi:hypothetical protein